MRLFGVNAIGQLVGLASQLLSVPLLIWAWGKPLYAEWLLISTIPSYLSIADLGFGFAAGNAIGMLDESGDTEAMLEVYQSTFVIVLSSCALFCVALISFAAFAPVTSWMHLAVFKEGDLREILILLGINILLAQIIGVIRTPLRSGGRTARGGALAAGIAAVQLGGVVLIAFTKSPPVVLAVTVVVINFIGTVVMAAECKRLVPWVRFGFSRASRAGIMRLLAPALTQNLFPLAYALNLQGTLSAIAVVLGPSAVLVFSTTRTMTRAINQLTNLIEGSFAPELSIAIGASKLDVGRRLHRKAAQVSFWSTFVLTVAVFVTGPYLYAIWTHRLTLEYPVFIVLLSAMVANGAYFGSWAVPFAVNRHVKLSGIFLLICAAGLVASCIGMRWLGLTGAALGVLAAEVATGLVVVPMACAIVGDSVPQLLKEEFSLNFRWLRKRAASS